MREAEKMLASVRDSLVQLTPGFQTEVPKALQGIRKTRRLEHARQRELAEAIAHEQRLAMLTKQLGLSTSEAEEVRAIMAASRKLLDQGYQAMRKAGDWKNRIVFLRHIRKERNRALSDVMSPSQYEQFQALDLQSPVR